MGINFVTIDINTECPFKCPGCEQPKQQMGIVQLRTIFNKLPNKPKVIEIGCEALLHKKIITICGILADEVVKPRLNTTGCAGKRLDKIADRISGVVMIDKYGDKRNDVWFNHEDAFLKQEKFLSHANDLGIPIIIRAIINKKNVEAIDSLIDRARKYDATLQVARYVPKTQDTIKLGLTNDEWEDLCYDIHDEDNVKIIFPSEYSYSECVAGKSRLSIAVNGDCFACPFSVIRIGNIFDEKLENILDRASRLNNGECIAIKEARI